jgi:16S rRNA (cytosine1402-N4)-methyltransferase
LENTAFQHSSVMPEQVLALLQPKPGETFLDGTVGGGGHARLILEATAPDGRLIGLDRDPEALREAARALAPYGDRVVLLHRNFSDISQVLAERNIGPLDGLLLDLGVSSYQLDAPHRGFSFRVDAPLDMRMDPTTGMTAAEILNEMDADDLAGIFREFGEERYARRIARRVVQVRGQTALQTTRQLAELIEDCVPGGHVPARIHPATRVFQALRIYVNRELEHVAEGLKEGLASLRPGGRMAVISFHSLEDRMVKRLFRQEARSCICPRDLPLCACDHKPMVELLTTRGVRADEEEVADNPRARSATLRAVRRC